MDAHRWIFVTNLNLLPLYGRNWKSSRQVTRSPKNILHQKILKYSNSRIDLVQQNWLRNAETGEKAFFGWFPNKNQTNE